MEINIFNRYTFFLVLFLIHTDMVGQDKTKDRKEKLGFDHVVIDFQTGFQNTLVILKLNDSIIYSKINTTNQDLGYSGTTSIPIEFFRIGKITLSVDNKKCKRINYKGYKFIYVNFRKGRFNIRHSNKVVYYY